MHAHTKRPETQNFKLLLGTAWMLGAVVLTTAVFGVTNIINPYFMIAAVLLCGPPAFVCMLLADKVS